MVSRRENLGLFSWEFLGLVRNFWYIFSLGSLEWAICCRECCLVKSQHNLGLFISTRSRKLEQFQILFFNSIQSCSLFLLYYLSPFLIWTCLDSGSFVVLDSVKGEINFA